MYLLQNGWSFCTTNTLSLENDPQTHVFLLKITLVFRVFSFKWSQLYFEFELWSHCISIGISFKRFQKKPRVKWAIWTWLCNFLKRKITPDWRSKPVILRSWISIELKSGKKHNETAKIPDVHRKWSNLTLFNKLWTISLIWYQSQKLLNSAQNCKKFDFLKWILNDFQWSGVNEARHACG